MKDINRVLNIIEDNILENYTLEEFARLTGYSKFYLSRSFKVATGYGLFEYIVARRITLASEYLLHTDIPIIEISMMLGFQSQEAFSRKFKDIYYFPPGKYRKMMTVLNQKQEVEEYKMSDRISGWIVSGTAPQLYEFQIDEEEFHFGRKSARITSIESDELYNDGTFGTLMQSILADNYKEKRIRFSAFIKSNEVYKCGLWARVDDNKSDILQFDNMMSRPITGTNQWSYYSVVLDVADIADSIHFGVLLMGKGQVWIDQFSVEEVDVSIPLTNTSNQSLSLPKQPINLDFES